MASYPTSIAVLATHNSGDIVQPADVNTPNGEIVAVETGLLNGFAHTIKPLSDNTYDAGSSSLNFRDVFLKRNLTNNGYAGVGAAIISNASKQIVEQVLTNGQLVIGSTGAAPAIGGISAGAGISVTNGAGTITVADTRLSLLHQGSGTDTTATPTTVDSFNVLNILTTKDTLLVYYNIEAITQNVANVVLYQGTDPVTIVSVSAGATITAGTILIGHAQIMARQGSSTALQALAEGMNSASARMDQWNNPSYTTAWTGAWNLGLRHGGVVSGGTFKYVWAIYNLTGE